MIKPAYTPCRATGALFGTRSPFGSRQGRWQWQAPERATSLLPALHLPPLTHSSLGITEQMSKHKFFLPHPASPPSACSATARSTKGWCHAARAATGCAPSARTGPSLRTGASCACSAWTPSQQASATPPVVPPPACGHLPSHAGGPTSSAETGASFAHGCCARMLALEEVKQPPAAIPRALPPTF